MISLVDILKFPYNKKFIFISILTVIIYICNELFFHEAAFAAVDLDITARIYNKFSEVGFEWGRHVSKYALWLLGITASYELILIGIKKIRGDDLGEVIASLVYMCLWVSLFLVLINASADLSMRLIKGFEDTAIEIGQASGNFKPSSLMDILEYALNIVENVFESGSILKLGDGILTALLGIGVFVCFCFIIGMAIVIRCEAFIVLNVGIFLLGFGGCRYTRPFASNFLRYALGVGLKIFIIELLLGVVFIFLEQYSKTEAFSLIETMVLLACVFILAFLVKVLPDSLANMVTNYSGSSGGAMTGAMAAMTGMAVAAGKGTVSAATGNPAPALTQLGQFLNKGASSAAPKDGGGDK